MTFKRGVALEELKPQTVLALVVCDGLYRDQGVAMVVTSVNDGRHMARSKHYTGAAFDLRTKNIPESKRGVLLAQVSAALAPLGFDVLWESEGLRNEHLHVEWDPK